jgi:hypothetical protein
MIAWLMIDWLVATAPLDVPRLVRIPANLNTDSGDCERGFRRSRTLIGAERRS